MASTAVLHGRDVELAALVAALGNGGSCALVGEAGIGKTTLLQAAVSSSGRRLVQTGGLATLRWVPRFVLARSLGRTELGGDLEGATSLVERQVGDGVLLIDDVQWADDETMQALPHLVGRSAMLAAVRRDDPDAAGAVEALAEAGFTIIDLGPLHEDACRRLVEAERPDLPASVVAHIVGSSGGNPLLLRELALAGVPSASFRRAVAGRLRSLPAGDLDAVALLGLAGHPLPDDGGYEEVVRRGFADRADAEVHLRHGLIGEVAVEELADSRKAALHVRLARLVADPVESAQHFALGGDRESAHRIALDAAERTEALGVKAALLGLAAANAEGAHADELRIRAAEALCLAGSFRDVEAALEGLETEDTELRALAGLFRARARWEAGDDEGYRRQLGDALAAVAGSGSRVETRLRIEAVRLPLMLDNEPEVALEEAEAAVDLARAAGVDEARALNLLGIARQFLKGEGWEEPFTDAIRVARERGDALTELYAANNLVSGHESSGEPARGREIAAAASARAVELGLVSLRRQLDASAINLDFHAGEYERSIDHGEALLPELVEPLTIGQLIVALALSHVDCGGFKRAGELVDRLAGGPTEAPGAREIIWVRAELALWSGRPAAALEDADAYVALDGLTDDLILLGHPTRAWALADLEREPSGELPAPRLPLTAPMPVEVDALRLLVRGDAAEAAHVFAQAAEGYHGLHLRGELRSLYGAGEAFRRAGDAAGARDLLLEVEHRAESHGMRPLLARVHRSLRLLGERRAAPRGTGDTLTPREHELLVLVGDGLSNIEIARRLGLTRRTVETELRTASAKLGATSRAQAAVLALRR